MKKFKLTHDQHVFKRLTKTTIANYIANCLKENGDIKQVFIIEPEIETVDLFETPEKLTPEARSILMLCGEIESYEDCAELKKLLNGAGYDFEYGLDAQPYNLHKI